MKFMPPKNTKNYTPIEGELWRPAVGFSDRYYVSNMGRVFTTSAHGKKNNPTIMKLAQDFDARRGRLGYMRTTLDRTHIRVHRVVAATWVPNPENKPLVNHKNGNKADNRAANLEWCTSSENQLHAYDTGLEKPMRGNENPKTKLTEAQVRRFKREWAMRPRLKSRKAYAEEFGVSEAAIKDIVRGRSWSWLTT